MAAPVSLALQTLAAQHRDMSAEEIDAALHYWPIWARPEQLEPAGNWTTWLVMAGRGFGKTRTGAEWVRSRIAGGASRIAIAGRTSADVRDVMVEGPSGIIAISPRHERPTYEPSKRRLTWPNGAVGTTYSAEEPESARGPQHDTIWADEIAAWTERGLWDQLMFGLRIGSRPRVFAGTTPRPVRLVRDVIKDPHTVVTRGRTYDNASNLAASFLSQVITKYEGTRLGRQELDGELLIDVPGALWTYERIDAARVDCAPTDMRRLVVAVDPAVTSGESSNETGIVVAGLGADGHAYVIADKSMHGTASDWGFAAIAAWRGYGADRVIGEVNNGGDLIEATLRAVDQSVPYRAVHASRGKTKRAEPIAALYEQGRVHHVGTHTALEDQLCAWSSDGSYYADGSPDRADALVWALTELMLAGNAPRAFGVW